MPDSGSNLHGYEGAMTLTVKETFIVRRAMNEAFKLAAEVCRKSPDATPEKLAELFEHLVNRMS